MFKDKEEAVRYLESKGYKVKLVLRGSYNPESEYCKACLDPRDGFSLRCERCVHPPIESIVERG